MKKLFVLVAILFLASGCDTGNMKTLSCTSTTTQNGIITNTKYDVKYAGDDVKHVTITYHYNQDGNVDEVDGVNADTDGLKEDDDTLKDGTIDSDEVVDGVVGEAIDESINAVTDTILDIAGIKSTFENQLTSYEDIEGFSYQVEKDGLNEYKVIYEIDMDKINDTDLARFDIDRNFDNLTSDYEDLGYTCK